MKRIRQNQHPILWTVLWMLCVLYLSSDTQQGRAETLGTTSTIQNARKTPYGGDKYGGEQQTIQIAPVYLFGGFVLLVGAFLAPGLLPQLRGYQGKLYHLLANTIKTYKMILHSPPKRRLPYSLVPGVFTETFRTTKEESSFPKPQEMPIAYHTLRCEQIVSSTYALSTPQSATVEMTRKFFQQSGFIFKRISAIEWRVSSAISQYKYYGEIPVFIADHAPLHKGHLQHIYENACVSSHDSLSAKIVFVVVNTLPDYEAYQQIYTYKIRHNFTIILLSDLFITKSLKYSSCAQELAEKVTLATKQSNLYAMNTPVADPLSFFGRSTLVEQLRDAVAHYTTIGLFGPPKIGKTWLSWQFTQILAEHLVVYVDLYHLRRHGSSVYWAILNDCIRDAAFKYPDLRLADLAIGSKCSENEESAFMHDLVSLWERLKTKHKDIKVLLLLDQAEQLIPTNPNNNNGFPGFRNFLTVIQNLSHQYRCLISILIFTGLKSSQFDGGNAIVPPPFQDYKEIFLTSLSEDECNQMVKTIGVQMGLRYTEESLSRLYYETGGHPYVTRQLCGLITKNLRHPNTEQWDLEVTGQITVQVQDVERAVCEYIEYKPEYLESIWRQFSQAEREIMVTMLTKDSCSVEDLLVTAHGHQREDAREKALATLLENDLIEQWDDKYSIKMGLFSRIIATAN